MGQWVKGQTNGFVYKKTVICASVVLMHITKLEMRLAGYRTLEITLSSGVWQALSCRIIVMHIVPMILTNHMALLTHWDLNKIRNSSQMTFSYAF